MVDISSLINLASDLKKRHDEHRRIAVDIDQRHDPLGTALTIRFQAALPPHATAVAFLASGWGFMIESRDDHIFRDESGDFFTSAPVINQSARIYIPYGVLGHRKAGVYDLQIHVVLAQTPGSAGTRIAEATTKVVLPPPQPWRKVDYLWPLIALCMAVVRADHSTTTNEIRHLKSLLVAQFRLGPADMEPLRLAMKASSPPDLPTLVDAVCLRMPHLAPEDLLTILLGIARADAPIHPREHTLLRTIAAHLGLDERAWTRLLDRHEL